MDEFWKTALTAFSSAGVAGCVLAWYLVKFEPSQKAMRDEFWRAMDGQRAELAKISAALYVFSKADMLRLIASPHVSDSVKEAASELVKGIAKEVEKDAPK